jgi:hypothetical protein
LRPVPRGECGRCSGGERRCWEVDFHLWANFLFPLSGRFPSGRSASFSKSRIGPRCAKS